VTRSIIIAGLVAVCCIITATLARAEKLTVGFGFAKPPFVFAKTPKDQDDLRGIELEIMRQALAERGHSFDVRYMTYNRLSLSLKTGKIDAAATVRPELEGVYYSDNFVYFHNVAITRKSDNIRLDRLSDLKTRKIIAWQGATKDLGASFNEVANLAPLYRELADQGKQVKLFLRGRVNTIVIDRNIFSYWAKNYGEAPQRYMYHPLFGGRTNFAVGFIKKSWRDDFNWGLRILKKSGRYDALYTKYSGG